MSIFEEIKKGLTEAIESEGGVCIGTNIMIEQLRELAEEKRDETYLSNLAIAVADRLEELLDYKQMYEDLCK